MLSDRLQDIIPNACIFKGLSNLAEQEDPSDIADETDTVNSLPRSIFEIAANCSNTEQFLHSIVVSDDDRSRLERATRDQADNQLWLDSRKGRITASEFYSVHTKVKSLTSSKQIQTDSLVSKLMGEGKDISHVEAVKWGKNQERVARIRYIQISKGKHTDFKVEHCGLFLHKTHPYLGATPDGLVSCMCHGEGVLEIKCPKSCASEQPNEQNVPYLNRSETGYLELKKNHSYYAQVQGQMAITGRFWCHFFIYSLAGFVLLEIHFDKLWWDDLQADLIYFYEKFMSPKILSKYSCLLPSTSTAETYTLAGYSSKVHVEPLGDASESDVPWLVSDFGEVVETETSNDFVVSVYNNSNTQNYCNLCKLEFLTKCKTFGQSQIECQKCHCNYHMRCVGIKTRKQLSKIIPNWFCKLCA